MKKTEQDAIREHMGSASESEQREFGRALLESKDRSRPPLAKPVPRGVVWLSRVGSLIVAGLHAARIDWTPSHVGYFLTVLLFALVAWFPNLLGDRAAHLMTDRPMRRAVTPWAMLGLGWFGLVLQFHDPLIRGFWSLF